MSRTSKGLLAGAFVLTLTSGAMAAWPEGFWNSYHVSKRWPVPYVYQDRQFVYAPFDAIEANGWRRQNLLGAHHFEEDNKTLSKAGELKVYAILTQSPVHRRTVFVQRGANRDETLTRIDAVQQFATHLVPAGELPDVQDTHLQFEGRSADEVFQNMNRYYQSAPAPALKAPVTDNGGGGN